MKRSAWILITLIGMLWLAGDSARAQTTAGVRLFEQHCATCHGNPGSRAGAPDTSLLWKMTPEAIYAALAKGAHASLQGLADNDKREIASYYGGRKLGAAAIANAKL